MLRPGMKVRVYRNLNRRSLFGPVYSVMDCKTRLVIAHVTDIKLKEVKFVVSEAGKRRARKTGKRNVHAFIEGCIVTSIPSRNGSFIRVGYRPFDSLGFREMTGETKAEVHSARWVSVNNCGVFAYERD